jgi:hypothetical protein
MEDQRSGIDPGAAVLTIDLNLEKAFSIGLRSGL